MDAVTDRNRLEARIAELESENARLARMLSDGGQSRGAPAASLLHTRIAELESLLADARSQAQAAGEREREALLTVKNLTESPSWQLTAPLRAVKQALSRKS